MRAISLALTLLVTLVLANHQHHPMAADDLAFLAHRLDRRSYLHDPFRRLGSGDPALAAVAAAATESRICPWHRPTAWRMDRTPDSSNLSWRSLSPLLWARLLLALPRRTGAHASRARPREGATA